MNPYTQHLLSHLDDPRLSEFIARWDSYESTMIDIFRAGQASAAKKQEHQELRVWLRAHYPDFQASLQPYWQGKKIGGRPTATDPFAWLLSIERATDLIDNWPAMQTLPAAREALNEFLLRLIENN